MRLISLVAPTSQQAVADLRAELGHDAVVVTTQTTDDGQVRITGALAEDDIDLADVLSPQSTQDGSGWLTELGEFHGWPETWRETVRWLAEDGPAVEPNASLASLLRTHCAFQKPAYTSVRPILFSGPPGSGKTATIAKIAASCVLDGRSVDVLTLDVERAGAVAQVTGLLTPLDIVPIAVTNPDELGGDLAACCSDMILIDMPSTNPFGKADLNRLSTVLEQHSIELILVLAAGGSSAECAEIGQCYSALGAERMVATKLDVARRLGGILAAADTGLAFCEAGIGPTIGDGFCTLTAEGLARLLLHRFQHSITEVRHQ